MTESEPIRLFDQRELAKIAHERLLQWFAVHGRNLPWRHTRDPYRIMVSEVMLQQTQVDRVIPKYHMFLELFPTLEALAAAPTADVIRAWTGLGYNRRAVNLQRTARVVLEQHQGQFPRDIAGLMQLPGIGRYTAGAIACFAFEQDVAFVDTNIRRAIRRFFFAPGDEPGEAQLLAMGEAIVPTGNGWAWNQALMELGALICTAASPVCWRCPLQEHCADYAARRNADEQVLEQVVYQPPQPRRKVAETREQPFAGSSRFYRGRVIEVLRQLPPGQALGLIELGRLVKEPFEQTELAWLQKLVDGLARDGLLAFDEQGIRLP